MKILCILILCITILLPAPAWARWKLDKKDFSSSYMKHDLSLPLRGVGVKTLFMMRVFVASFYVDTRVTAQQALEDIPKHLEVKFFTSIPGKDFANFTMKSMKQNVTAKEFIGISDRFALMKSLFPNVKSGDVFSLTYKPGVGTIFTLNGVEKGVVPGADFAKAIFSTWIGPKPIDNILKRQVLGFEKMPSVDDKLVKQLT